MCGIAGSIGTPVDTAALSAMNRALAHRGPDDEGMHAEGPAGLAMRRLKIIDLEGGHQPLANEDQTVWTVFNGEIYNFLSLRRALERQGHRFSTSTDSEVLVHLYEEQGEYLVHKLRGMFAFALWDKTRKRAMLARDPMGIKPLFYWFGGGVLLFASEIKALLCHPLVSRQIDWQALSDYLSFLYIPAPKTIFRGIRKLPPGCMLLWENGEISMRRYWDVALHPDSPSCGQEIYQRELRELAQDAVRSHLISDVPVGAFLSGGVDSSIVTALMAEERGPGFDTFSVGFDAASHDELSYAKLVADHLGTRHHELRLNVSAMDDLPSIVACFDEPFGDSSAIPTYHLSRFARQHVTVALAGDGGDELFGGYAWLQRQRYLDALKRLPAILPKSAVRALKVCAGPSQGKEGFWAGMARVLEDAGLGNAQAFYRRATCLPEDLKQQWLQPGVLEELRGYTPWSFFEQTAQGGGGDIYDQILLWDSKVYLPDDDLCKVDRASMAHALEVRVPVLDVRLMEFSARLPLEWKLKGLTTKYIWKRAFRDLLPAPIFRQRKQGFSIPLQRWMRSQEGALRRLLLDKDSFCAMVFRTKAVETMISRQASGHYRLGGPLYLLLVLELWAKNTLGEQSPLTLAETAAA